MAKSVIVQKACESAMAKVQPAWEAAEAPGQQTMNDIFEGNKKIMVKQEWAALECCGCEAKNRYRVSVPNDDDGEGATFLYVSEDSGCCERICCSVNRSLTLNVHQGQNKDGKIVQAMHKPFHFQGCCCCRPKFEVYEGEKNTKRIGTVTDPFRCCCMDQRVFDVNDTLLYTTYGSICQCGFCCPFCCSIDFQIKTANGDDVGLISKRPMTCSEMCTKTNRFTIDFPDKANPMDKRLLFAAAMLADLEYFEQNKNDNGGG